ncbi:hypothetical protein [Leifsonia shinshuensis]
MTAWIAVSLITSKRFSRRPESSSRAYGATPMTQSADSYVLRSSGSARIRQRSSARSRWYHGVAPSSAANAGGELRLPPTGPMTNGMPRPAAGDG